MSNTIIITLWIGAIQALLFSALVLAKKHKHKSDWALLTWFCFFAFHFISILLTATGTSQVIVPLLAKTFSLVHGPFLLIYTSLLFNKAVRKSSLHFLPFVTFSIVGFYILVPTPNSWEVALLIAKVASLLIYPLYVLKGLSINNADTSAVSIQQYYRLPWLRTLCILLLINITVGIGHVMTDLVLGIQFSELIDVLSLVAVVTTMGFFGLKYGMVYQQVPLPATTEGQKSYRHSPLQAQKIETIKQQINEYLERTSAYLDQDFSLPQLSESLKIPKHHLSEVINAGMGSNFYDLINKRRVQYAMQRMKENSDQHLTLEGLGYESGFNTKSAFYHHFKEQTGKTPGQFKSECVLIN